MVSALVVLHGVLALLSTGDARAYPFVFQVVRETVGVVAAVCEQPIDILKAVEQRSCADVVADPTGGDEHVERSSPAVTDGMQLGTPVSDETVHWTVSSSLEPIGSTNQAAMPPF